MGIKLDGERGLNPGLEICYFCGEAKGVVLWGKLSNDSKKELKKLGIKDRIDGDAPKHIVIDKDPCSKCKDYMKQGIIFMSARDDSEEEN